MYTHLQIGVKLRCKSRVRTHLQVVCRWHALIGCLGGVCTDTSSCTHRKQHIGVGVSMAGGSASCVNTEHTTNCWWCLHGHGICFHIQSTQVGVEVNMARASCVNTERTYFWWCLYGYGICVHTQSTQVAVLVNTAIRSFCVNMEHTICWWCLHGHGTCPHTLTGPTS